MTKRRILFVILAILTIFAFSTQAAIVSFGGAGNADHKQRLLDQNIEFDADADYLKSLGNIKSRSSNCPPEYNVTVISPMLPVGTICGGKYKDFSCDSTKGYTRVGDSCVLKCDPGFYFESTSSTCESCTAGNKCEGGIGDDAEEIPCDKGYYQDLKEQASCKKCGDADSIGMYSDIEGAKICKQPDSGNKAINNNTNQGYCDCVGDFNQISDVENCAPGAYNYPWSEADLNADGPFCNGYSGNLRCHNGCTTCDDGHKKTISNTCTPCQTHCSTGLTNTTECLANNSRAVDLEWKDDASGSCQGTPVGDCYACTACDTTKGYRLEGSRCVFGCDPMSSSPVDETAYWRGEDI